MKLLGFAFVFLFGLAVVSLGSIECFFNTPVFGDNLEEVVISYINMARENISISAYSFDDPDIARSLISAADRGVRIRMTIDSDYWGPEVDLLDSHPNVEVFNDLKSKGYRKHSRQHHSKFIVVDYNVLVSPVRNTVITGSFNFTSVSSSLQYNNIVVVKDNPDVANMYIQEFNEEWGGGEFEFNASASRFGRQKTDPPPYFHQAGNVEVFFSYSDRNKVKDRISELLLEATNVYLCIYSFSTNSELFGVLYNLIDKVEVYGVFDGGQAFGQFSAFPLLREKKPENFVLDGSYRVLHNKYIVLNYNEESPENAIVVTGSYNFSKNAEENNEENVIIIRNSPLLAKKFMKDFIYHFTQGGGSLETSLPSFLKTNIVCFGNSTNSLYGRNLHKVLALFVSNNHEYLPLTIVSNLTNSVVFLAPQIEGRFDVIALLVNGEREVVPVSLLLLSGERVSLVVNDGNRFINAAEPIKIELYSPWGVPATPYVRVFVDGVTKYVLLNKEGSRYKAVVFLDALTPNPTNNMPIVFNYEETFVTNYLVLPAFSYSLTKPKKVFKNSWAKVKVNVRSVWGRRIRISANGNVPLSLSDDGIVSFFVGNQDKVIIFFTLEDDLGNSFSESIEFTPEEMDGVLLYPTVARKGERIFIEGGVDRIEVFDKNYNKVMFSLGEDEYGRKFIIPAVHRQSELLFVVLYRGNNRILKKVVIN